MYFRSYVFSSLTDDYRRIGVVYNHPVFADRDVQVEQVPDTHVVPAADAVLAYVVTARLDPQPDPLNGQ